LLGKGCRSHQADVLFGFGDSLSNRFGELAEVTGRDGVARDYKGCHRDA
jgi:hypothetical protein